MAQRWAYRYIAICYVGLMLAQRLHACVTTLGQHRPNMLGQQRPSFALRHCANIVLPTLGQQSRLHWTNVVPTYVCYLGNHRNIYHEGKQRLHDEQRINHQSYHLYILTRTVNMFM